MEAPQLFLEPILLLAFPLAPEKFTDCLSALEELGPVAPLRVLGVGECDAIRVAAVPGIFGRLDFLASAFLGEWWQRRP